ncbi:MAG: 30S ribosomal protein S16 [Candidatus Riflebacteria bacterium]|nr:30S ribosomal protein S16 [Candidatus Riflebacteria bacterium]
MTAIRLTRVGTHKKPYYRIVVVDSRKARDGEYIECVGYYHPLREPAKVELNEDRLKYYVSCGASVSATVRALCKGKGLVLPGKSK